MDDTSDSMLSRINELEHVSLNQEKRDLYNKMEHTDENMFITGKAGCGKSYLLNYFVEHTTKKTVIVAPTGIAALNVGGQTIHSFFQLKLEPYHDLEDIKREGISGKQRMLMRELDVLIVDEVSMVSSNMMDAMDLKMRMANQNNQPFGGKQVLLFGDLYQLPPVINDKEAERCIEDKYGSKLFFRAPAFRHTTLHRYILNTIFRQDDEDFVRILNDIRIGHVSSDDLDMLNSRCGALSRLASHAKFVTITPRKDRAAEINQENLDKIPRQEYTYYASIEGNFGEKSYPTDKELKLKVGAQVMMLVNDVSDSSGHRRWANGSLGVISELTPSSIKVMINKVEYSIDRHAWNKKTYEYNPETKRLTKRIVASFKQYPLCLAYALTIHKAQGQTYQSVAIDMGNGAFDTGQTYVALSRCVSLDNLYLLTPISSRDIKVNQEVLNYMGDSDAYGESSVDVYRPGQKQIYDYDDEPEYNDDNEYHDSEPGYDDDSGDDDEYDDDDDYGDGDNENDSGYYDPDLDDLPF